ncbi:NAD(P)H-hydrate dehydratase [Vallitalea okinawensis]|uniref:NAD(P)H-hydrate dehydratase n=1 Tax=Vallitalea okinawensis TaxID=2078660 RepID=UPI000CFC0F6F|nr:NAD(P)H-hydrate dehydratase [Vallitalea okinawensis]
MKVVYNSQMRLIDESAIKDYGIPGIILMENAAISVVNAVETYKQSGKILIFCGQGNNGGDGFAVARHLNQKHYQVEVFIIGVTEKIVGDAKINYDMLEPLGINVTLISQHYPIENLNQIIGTSDLVLDCIFGTGLSREVTGVYLDVINMVNAYSSYTIAVDIPSGINGDTGEIMGVAIKADETVTFALPKIGNLLYPGAYQSGELTVADIGIPQNIPRIEEANIFTLTKEEAYSKLPKRFPWSNKGSFGKVSLIAGSKNMTGAAILSGKAAYRIGSGLVRLIIPEDIQPIIQQGLAEAVTLPYGIDGSGYIINRDTFEQLCTQSTVIGIGPGLGQEDYAYDFLQDIIKKSQCPLVIDADGLNLIANNKDLLKRCSNQIIITPHIGEMSRLTGKSIAWIKGNPIDTASEFSKEYGVVCVLKDARTIVSIPDGEVYINQTGNQGMSTAGSGDVLTGIICGLIAQGVSVNEAAFLGVYFHGASGDWVAKENGMRALMAGDLCDGLGGILC